MQPINTVYIPLGELFDAWMNRRLGVRDRVVAVVRARMFLHNWRHHIRQLSKTFPDLYSTTRSFISPASFNIFNRLCDSLIAHTLAYSKYYPEYPFCPWLMGTGFLEHFFGLARQLLPDFAYTELLKMIKHIMVRQKLLLSGKFNDKKERTSRSGYILDYDAKPLTDEELMRGRVTLTTMQINQLVDLAHREADSICRDLLHMTLPKSGTPLAPLVGPPTEKKTSKSKSLKDLDDEYDSDDWDGEEEETDYEIDDDQLAEEADESDRVIAAARDATRDCELHKNYEATVSELESQPTCLFAGPPVPPLLSPVSASILNVDSELFDDKGNLSISRMLDARDGHQSGTKTRSERTLVLDPKFDKAKVTAKAFADENPDVFTLTTLSVKEGSHRVRVAQAMKGDDKPKKIRQMRWQTVANELSGIIPAKGPSHVSYLKLVQSNRLLLDSVVPNISGQNVNTFVPLRRGNFVIMSTKLRFYIGEVLDIYKQAAGSRYGSVDDANSASSVSFLALRVYLPLQVQLVRNMPLPYHGY